MPELDYYYSFDLTNIVTPVNPGKLANMLRESHYDEQETQFLESGFTHGFDIGYRGPVNRQSLSDNIPLRIGSKEELWNKLMKEVKLKRVAGPFVKIPFDNFIQSPIGLVPKAGGQKTRLIFHLSYKFERLQEDKKLSLTHHTPKEICSIKYNDLDVAVKTILNKAYSECENSLSVEKGQGQSHGTITNKLSNFRPIFMSKTDIQSAFRLVPLLRKCWNWLVMKAQDPKTNKTFYFVDKCLPFRASISCAVFQRISNALKHLIEHRLSIT